MRTLPPAILLLAVLASADVVGYLDGAELQCEDSRTVAAELRFILRSDADAIRAHLFPDYSGRRTWTLSDFIYGHFVPDHAGAVLGDDPESQITSTAATEASQAVSNNSMEVAMAQSEQVVNMANQMANNPVSCINANLAAPVGKNAESNMVPMKTLINIVGFICRMEEIVGCVDPLLC